MRGHVHELWQPGNRRDPLQSDTIKRDRWFRMAKEAHAKVSRGPAGGPRWLADRPVPTRTVPSGHRSFHGVR